MKKIIVTAKQFAEKTAREKVTAAKSTGTGINNNVGYFPDGGTVASAISTSATNLETALNNYDSIPSDTNRALAEDAENDCGLKMDDCVNYVQSKVNAVSDPEIATAMAYAAALDVRKKPTRQPKPEVVTDAGAESTKIPQTIMLKIKKKSKYSKYFEIWISLTPEVESSWMLKDTTCGKQLLVQGLNTGQKYYLRIVACNNAGKSDPSEIYYQIAA